MSGSESGGRYRGFSFQSDELKQFSDANESATNISLLFMDYPNMYFKLALPEATALPPTIIDSTCIKGYFLDGNNIQCIDQQCSALPSMAQHCLAFIALQ